MTRNELIDLLPKKEDFTHGLHYVMVKTDGEDNETLVATTPTLADAKIIKVGQTLLFIEFPPPDGKERVIRIVSFEDLLKEKLQ